MSYWPWYQLSSTNFMAGDCRRFVSMTLRTAFVLMFRRKHHQPCRSELVTLRWSYLVSVFYFTLHGWGVGWGEGGGVNCVWQLHMSSATLPGCHGNMTCRLRQRSDHVLLESFCSVDYITSVLRASKGMVNLAGRAVVWCIAHALCGNRLLYNTVSKF